MPTINNIIEEIKEVPVNKLEDIYSLIHSFNATKVVTKGNKEKILAFAGALNNLNDADYNDFKTNIETTRAGLFNRQITI